MFEDVPHKITRLYVAGTRNDVIPYRNIRQKRVYTYILQTQPYTTETKTLQKINHNTLSGNGVVNVVQHRDWPRLTFWSDLDRSF